MAQIIEIIVENKNYQIEIPIKLVEQSTSNKMW